MLEEYDTWSVACLLVFFLKATVLHPTVICLVKRAVDDLIIFQAVIKNKPWFMRPKSETPDFKLLVPPI